MSGRIPPPGDVRSSNAGEMNHISESTWIGANAISSVGSLAVILTGVLFYKQLVKKKVSLPEEA